MAIIKVITLVAAVMAVCAEEAYNAAPYGRSSYAEEPYEDRDYKFSYNVKDDYTYNQQSREEQKNGNTVTGQYTVLEPTGDLRVVNYIADDYGFRADVQNQEGKGPYEGQGYQKQAARYPQPEQYEGPSGYPQQQAYKQARPVYKAPERPSYKAPEGPSYKAPEGPSYKAPERQAYQGPSYKPHAERQRQGQYSPVQVPVQESYNPTESYRPAPVYPRPSAGYRPAPKAPSNYQSQSY